VLEAGFILARGPSLHKKSQSRVANIYRLGMCNHEEGACSALLQFRKEVEATIDEDGVPRDAQGRELMLKDFNLLANLPVPTASEEIFGLGRRQ